MNDFEKLENLFAELGKKKEIINQQIDDLIEIYIKGGEPDKVNSLRLYKSTMVDQIIKSDLLDEDEWPKWKIS